MDRGPWTSSTLCQVRALQTSLESWNGWGWDAIHMATPENKQETSTILRQVATLKKRGNQEEVVFLWGWFFTTKEHNRGFLSWTHLEKNTSQIQFIFHTPKNPSVRSPFPRSPTFSHWWHLKVMALSGRFCKPLNNSPNICQVRDTIRPPPAI